MDYVKLFQEKNNLVPDGIAGANTLKKMMQVWGIKSHEHMAHLMGQGYIESNGFTQGRESLNYSYTALLNTFLYYRRNQGLGYRHARRPGHKADQVAIANNVYADKNRDPQYKLGNTKPGDGWNNRGVGCIQLTGKKNIQDFLSWANLPANMDRDIIERDFFWQTLLFYFREKVRWQYCNEVTEDSCARVTKLVQGGDSHLKLRSTATKRFYEMIKH